MKKYKNRYENVACKDNATRLRIEKERVNTIYEVKTITAIVNKYIVREKIKLLDVGTGRGRLAIPLGKKGIQVTGIDIDKKNLPNNSQGSSFKACDFFHVSSTFKCKWDAVCFAWTTFGIILGEDFRLVDSVVNEIKKIIKLNGLVIIDNVADEEYLSKISTRVLMVHKDIYLYCDFSRKFTRGIPTVIFFENSLERLLKRHNFRLVHQAMYISEKENSAVNRKINRTLNFFTYPGFET